MIIPIKSIHDLRNEIVRLETLTSQQEVAIKQRFSSPSTIYKTLLSALPKSAVSNSGKSVKLNGLLNQDIISAVSKYLLPLTLNSTLFKGSGFLTRTIVTFLSKHASGYINQNSVSTSLDKIKTVVSNSKITDTLLAKLKPLENLFSKIKLPAKRSTKSTSPVVINTPVVIKTLD